MQFCSIENAACVTHRSIPHSVQTTPAMLKFGAWYYKGNMNHTEGDSLRRVAGPALSPVGTSGEGCCTDNLHKGPGEADGMRQDRTNTLTWGAWDSEFLVREANSTTSGLSALS